VGISEVSERQIVRILKDTHLSRRAACHPDRRRARRPEQYPPPDELLNRNLGILAQFASSLPGLPLAHRQVDLRPLPELSLRQERDTTSRRTEGGVTDVVCSGAKPSPLSRVGSAARRISGQKCAAAATMDCWHRRGTGSPSRGDHLPGNICNIFNICIDALASEVQNGCTFE
jgi:hypothetical protein